MYIFTAAEIPLTAGVSGKHVQSIKSRVLLPTERVSDSPPDEGVGQLSLSSARLFSQPITSSSRDLDHPACVSSQPQEGRTAALVTAAPGPLGPDSQQQRVSCVPRDPNLQSEIAEGRVSASTPNRLLPLRKSPTFSFRCFSPLRCK